MDRRIDFIRFHDISCSADSIVLPLKEFCKLKNYNKIQLQYVCLIYSLTYCVASTIVIMNKMDEFFEDPYKFWEENKEYLVFQSDRRWVKFNNLFCSSFFDFMEKKIFDYLECKIEIDVFEFVNLVEGVKYFGRFSAFLFLEIYCCLFDKVCINNKLDWKKGLTVTSGILNVMGEDCKADLWDKSHNVEIDVCLFDKYANGLLDDVSFGKSLPVLETNLCAYRKLFKKSRYVGYYSDRVLEECLRVFGHYNQYDEDLKLIFKSREIVIDSRFLGEKNNWFGVRKELKKFYIKYGRWDWWNMDYFNGGLF